MDLTNILLFWSAGSEYNALMSNLNSLSSFSLFSTHKQSNGVTSGIVVELEIIWLFQFISKKYVLPSLLNS